MNKKAMIVITAALLIVVAALGYAFFRPAPPSPATLTPYTPPAANTGEAAPQPRSLQAYSPEVVAATTGTKLLFFHAPWCPQCRSIEESIVADGLPSGVTVFKVDYDTNQALRQKYGVTLQTTFVKIDDDGNKIASYVAYEEPNFAAVTRELLP